MVLHNSKWDKRAKTKYLKKHGIEPTKKSAPSATYDEPKAENDHEEPPVHDLDLEQSKDSPSTSGDETELQKDAADQQELEGYELPELEDDPEEQELIRRHIAQQKKKHEEQVAAKRAQQPPGFDESIFKQAEANAERSKLNQRVKRIGALAKSKNMIDIDSDSDFEDFMDELDEEDSAAAAGAAPTATTANDRIASASESQPVDKTKIDFLDELLH